MAKLRFSRSEAAEHLLRERVEELNARKDVNKWGNHMVYDIMEVAAETSRRMSSALQYVSWTEETQKEGLCLPKAVLAEAKKEFPGEEEFTYLYASNVKGGADCVLFAPSSEEAFLADLQRTWMEQDVEKRLAPLFAEEHKQKAHMFLAKKALCAKRGGRHRVREEILAYAQGYLKAWEKFGGEKAHPRPYVIVSPYGKGRFGVAYLLCVSPEQLIEDFENEFAVVLVMKA